MKLQEILQKFGGKEVDVSAFPSYQKWALGYYPTSEMLIDPNLHITLQLDITEAMAHYRQHYSDLAGASFTAYLIWRLVQSMNEIEAFNYRYIDGKWFHLEQPPVFIPVATGKDNNQFTSIQAHLHHQSTQTGRCLVYFGKRYRSEGKELIPFSISLNHGNTDPYLLDVLLQKLNARLTDA